MIYEKIDLGIDIDRLREYYHTNVAVLPPVMQSTAFGGWSILSYVGTYTDGWQTGHLCFKTDAQGVPYWDYELAEKLGVRLEAEHCNPTEVCTGYMLEVISWIRELGLNPCRARWSLLRAQSESTLHRDAADATYAVRLHIPVITNSQCTFYAGEEFAHMPADGSAYLIKVNRMHQIFNKSNEDRIHIIMNVFDAIGISKHHRMP